MPRSSRRRAGAPTQTSALVDGAFARAGLAARVAEVRLLAAFNEVAGPRIRQHARAECVHGGALVVRVRSAPWAQELGLLRGQLLAALRRVPGVAPPAELRFHVGPLDEVPEWGAAADEEGGPVPAPRRPHRDPNGDARVAAALREVGDGPLRTALAGLYAIAVSRQG